MFQAMAAEANPLSALQYDLERACADGTGGLDPEGLLPWTELRARAGCTLIPLLRAAAPDLIVPMSASEVDWKFAVNAGLARGVETARTADEAAKRLDPVCGGKDRCGAVSAAVWPEQNTVIRRTVAVGGILTANNISAVKEQLLECAVLLGPVASLVVVWDGRPKAPRYTAGSMRLTGTGPASIPDWVSLARVLPELQKRPSRSTRGLALAA